MTAKGAFAKRPLLTIVCPTCGESRQQRSVPMGEGHCKRHAPKKRRAPVPPARVDALRSNTTEYLTRMAWDTGERPIEEVLKQYKVEGGCWSWTGSINRGGYGTFKRFLDAKYVGVLAHRFSFEVHHGRTIVRGMELDHLCRNRRCINPDHLEEVTRRENILRGEGPTAVNARKVQCKRGHEFAGDNLLYTPQGGRRCRTCENDWRYARRKALAEVVLPEPVRPASATIRAVMTSTSPATPTGDDQWVGDCQGDDAWLWDESLDGQDEPPKKRAQRHALAASICRTCPMLATCRMALAGQTLPASGIWAGQLAGFPGKGTRWRIVGDVA
jgi:hypothetical protein